jgi:peptidoglycan/xylan/chitin deacetylase (PgdA/CDA1 family)
VLWSAWGRDWEPGARWDAVTRTVLRDLADGGTVLLHDTDRECAPGSWRVTLRALPAIVSACRDRGWSFGTLSEHLTTTPPGAGGVTAPTTG